MLITRPASKAYAALEQAAGLCARNAFLIELDNDQTRTPAGELVLYHEAQPAIPDSPCRKLAIMDGQQSQQFPAFSMAPIMKVYMDSLEAWKHNYEALTASTKDYQVQQTAQPNGGTKPGYDAAVASWQKSGEEIFKHFVEQQIELCHFFASRWENYLKLPDQFARCHTSAEMGQVQAAFLSRFASDYMQEATKLSQPIGKLMSNLAASRHV